MLVHRDTHGHSELETHPQTGMMEEGREGVKGLREEEREEWREGRKEGGREILAAHSITRCSLPFCDYITGAMPVGSLLR